MSPVARVARVWVPLAAVVTLLCGVIYVVGQQSYRMSADDPQIQIARDAASALARGATPDSVVGSAVVDVAEDLAPFIVVFDSSGQPVVGSGRLDGALASPPRGVLDYARDHAENRVTWQPRAGVRVASVTRAVEGGAKGFVFAGRSLAVAEEHIQTLGLLVTAGWLATMAAALVTVIVVELVVGRSG